MKKKERSAFLLESLEPRLLFSADLAPVPVDGGIAGAENESSLEISLRPDIGAVEDADVKEQARQEVIFVDQAVDDDQQLIDDIESQLEKGRQYSIVSLNSDRDGIAQISAYLNQQQEVAAVHILSHGADGEVFLGNSRLNVTTLDGYAEAIEGWQQALTSDADLLFYGCNIAAGHHGQDLINSLTLLTGADVAASDDVTGSAQFGGDWVLEYNRGVIETAEALNPAFQKNWNGVLSTFIVNTTDDTIDDSPGDGNALDAAGKTSLRAAIMEANALGGSHTIVLGAGTYTLSRTGSGEDAAATGDLDITCDLTITGVHAGASIIDGGGLDRVFDIRSSGSLTMSNVTVQGGVTPGSGGGLLVNSGSQLALDKVIIKGNQADMGGGIYNAGTVGLTDVEILNNGSPTTSIGGGLLNEGDATLNRVTISGNQADTGAGIYNDSSATNLTLTNITVSGNTAASTGGGLYTRGSVTVVNSTFTLNSASSGSGIRTQGGGGTVDLLNTIVADNSASASNPDVSGRFNSSGSNLIGDGTGTSDLVDGVSNDRVGTAGSPVDPMLDSLKDNGGFTQTHALQAGSPAIDPAGLSGAPPLDQRGFARDATPDIGAFEFGGTAIELIWADQDSGKIQVSELDGGNVTDLLTGLTSPVSVAVDVQAGKVYWSDDVLNNIQRANLDGTGVETIVASAPGMSAIELNIAGGKIYWLEGGGGSLNRANLDGTTPETISGAPNVATGLVLDVSGDKVYFADKGTAVIKQTSLTGAGTGNLINSGIDGPADIALDLVAGKIYWSDDTTGEILRANLADGSGVETVISGLSAPYGLAVDSNAGKLYWTDDTTDQLQRANIDGTGIETLVSGIVTPRDVDVVGVTGVVANAAPTLNLDADNSSGAGGNDYAFTFTEGDGATAIADSDTDVADVDSTTFDHVTLSVSGLLDGNAEELVLDGDTFALATATAGQDTSGGSYHVVITTGAGTANVTITKQGGGTFTEAETETLIEAIQYRHADGDNPTDGNRQIDVTVNDGTADSAAARTTINVTPVNDAPTLSGGPYDLGSTDEDSVSTGVQVTTILGGLTSSDADGDTLGIAVVNASGNGIWEYSTNSTDGTDGNWTTFGSVNGSNALLLSNSSWVRYVPDGQNGENVNIDFHAWDGTTGTASIDGTPSTADPAGGGGTMAYSSGIATANLTVTDQNDAPMITNVTGAPIVDESAVYSLDLTFSDPDDSTVIWTVNWGDGHISSAPSTGATTTLTHTYTQPGFTYNILVSANDGDVTVLQNELLVPSYAAGDSIFRYEKTTGAFLQEFATANGLDDPIQAIIGPDGNLYVTGEKSGHVLRYNAVTGAFIDEFVSAGNGGLNEPGGLAFGPDGDLYVSSFVTDEVLRYDGTSGAFIDAFVTAGSGGLNEPYSLTFGSDGNLYVNSYWDSQVLRYNGTTGAFIDVFVSSGSGGLSTPEQMIFGPDGNLYIASYDTNEVLRYNGATGAFIDAFVTAGLGGLNQTTGLAFGPDGNLYVSDHRDAVILRYNGTTGVFIDVYVSAGSGGLVKPLFISFLPEQQVTVTNVNDAPTLGGGPYDLGSTDEDNASSGVQVTTILGGLTSSDADGDTLGIAVVTASGNGIWQYSTNSTDGTDGTWTAFGSISANSALLLANSSWVRYVPDGISGESVNIDFHAWDGTTGTASVDGTPSTADPAGGGGTTAYSSGIATANLTVTDQNDAPIINSFSAYGVNEDDNYRTLTGISIADVDAGGADVQVTMDVANGVLRIGNPAGLTSITGNDSASVVMVGSVANINGALATLAYKPNPDYAGNDDPLISVNDLGNTGAGGPQIANKSVSLTVTPVNDPPTVVTNAPLNVPEEATRAITAAYLETTDPDTSPDQIIYTLTNLPSGGSVRLNGTTLTLGQTFTQDDINNNRLTYRDSDDGEPTSFQLTVSDGNTTLPAFSFSINGQPINDAPVVSAPGGALNATEQIGLAIHGTGFSVSDLDEAGVGALATLTVGEGTISVVVGNSGASVDSGDGTGTVTLSGSIAQLNTLLTGTSTGTITYLNNSDTPSSSTTLTVTVNDQGNTGSDPGLTGDGSSEEGNNTVTINIAPVNDGPTTSLVTLTAMAEDSGVRTITQAELLANAADVEGDSLTATGLAISAGAGSLVDNGNGTWDYTPAANDDTSVSFSYTIDDGTDTVAGSATLDITPVNDGPTTSLVTLTAMAEDSGVRTITQAELLANAADVEGDSLTATGLAISTGAGSLVDNGNGSWDYTPALNDDTSVSFSYTIDDGTDTVAGSATLDITPVNDPGTVTIDNTTPAQGDTLTASVSDPDGATGGIAYQWYSDGVVINGVTTATYTTTQADVGAVITVTANYTDDLGSAESLTSAPTAPVTNANEAPVAVNDNLNAVEDQSIVFTSVTDLLANDSDMNGDALTLAGFTQPVNGLLVDNGDGTLTYTPGGDFYGSDSFSYTIDDGNGATAGGTALIVVAPVGDTPRVTNVSTNAEVQSELIFINRNARDGSEVIHFKISGITNGELYLADGVSRIDNGDFITVAQGQAGLKFTPAVGSVADGSFDVESSEDGLSVAPQSGVATSTISILTLGPPPTVPQPSPPPAEPDPVTEEDVVEEEAEAVEEVDDQTDAQPETDNLFAVETPQLSTAPGAAKPSSRPGLGFFKRAASDDGEDRKTPDRSPLLNPQTLKMLLEVENLGELKTALAKVDIATLTPAAYDLMRGSLDAIKEELGREIQLGNTVLGSAIAASVGLSAGYVVWMLKGGSLMASVLSSIPAWQLADPLAILVGKKEDEDEDDESLKTIIEDGSEHDKDKKSKASKLGNFRKEAAKQ